jgi:hypothetical protein
MPLPRRPCTTPTLLEPSDFWANTCTPDVTRPRPPLVVALPSDLHLLKRFFRKGSHAQRASGRAHARTPTTMPLCLAQSVHGYCSVVVAARRARDACLSDSPRLLFCFFSSSGAPCIQSQQHPARALRCAVLLLHITAAGHVKPD